MGIDLRGPSEQVATNDQIFSDLVIFRLRPQNWFLTPPANPVQFFWLEMPSKYVPSIVLQVSTSTPTSRGSLRPPKWRPKARNGPKITVFGLDQPILVWRPSASGPNSGIHRKTYNSKRYPPYFEPFSLQRADTGEKKHKLAYIPIIQCIHIQQKVLDRNKMSQTHLKSFNSRQWDILQSISGVLHSFRGLWRAPKPYFGQKMTVSDPPCQPGPIFLAQNAF